MGEQSGLIVHSSDGFNDGDVDVLPLIPSHCDILIDPLTDDGINDPFPTIGTFLKRDTPNYEQLSMNSEIQFPGFRKHRMTTGSARHGFFLRTLKSPDHSSALSLGRSIFFLGIVLNNLSRSNSSIDF
jgi:hypothetical protein